MKILNQQIMKNNNLKKVFSLIMEHEPISRIELAAMTSLSKTTISSLVEDLINGGFVVDDGSADIGKQGRKPNFLRVNKEGNVVAVINWHIDDLELSLVDMSGQVVNYEMVPVDNNTEYEKVIPEAYYEKLVPRAAGRFILGFCLVVPSMLDAETNMMISTVLPVEDHDDVLGRICKKFTDVPVAVFNDTACYAYAEHVLTNWKFDTFMFLNINNGVGAVFVHDGKMIKGASGMRAQIGHFSIHRDGKKCTCGNRGCLENEVGETALVERAREEGLYEKLEVDGRITFASLGNQAKNGDETAKLFIRELAEDMAYALSNMAVVDYTKHIIIGGKGQRLGEYYLEELDKAFKQRGFQLFISQMDLKYTALGDDAIMRGAARYYIDVFYKFFEDMSHFIVME